MSRIHVPEKRKLQIRSITLENPMTADEMAAEMCISANAVRQYLSHLRREFNLPAIHAWRGYSAVYIWERKPDAKRTAKNRASGNARSIHAAKRKVTIPPTHETQSWLYAARDDGRLAA